MDQAEHPISGCARAEFDIRPAVLLARRQRVGGIRFTARGNSNSSHGFVVPWKVLGLYDMKAPPTDVLSSIANADGNYDSPTKRIDGGFRVLVNDSGPRHGRM